MKLLVTCIVLVASLLVTDQATAQRGRFFQPELRSVPLLRRPNRPGHVVGNGIRTVYQVGGGTSQPANTNRQRSAPRQSAPAYSQPVYSQPVYSQPGNAQPAYNQSTYQTYDSSINHPSMIVQSSAPIQSSVPVQSSVSVPPSAPIQSSVPVESSTVVYGDSNFGQPVYAPMAPASPAAHMAPAAPINSSVQPSVSTEFEVVSAPAEAYVPQQHDVVQYPAAYDLPPTVSSSTINPQPVVMQSTPTQSPAITTSIDRIVDVPNGGGQPATRQEAVRSQPTPATNNLNDSKLGGSVLTK